MNGSATHHPNRLLADFTAVMRATAETSRQAALDQSTADAKAYLEHLRARTGEEGLRKAAADDVAAIEGQSKAMVEQVRAEAERRIARRRELVEQELHDYSAAVDGELARVQARVAAFENEVSSFFERLLEGGDPTAFAAMASQAPESPTFTESEMQAIESELKDKHEAAVRAAAAETQASGGGEELPAYWWLDSPTAIAARAHHEPTT